MIWVIDNYDSFTYNLVQLLQKSGAETTVTYNDRFLTAADGTDCITGIVLSPGPCGPEEAGICQDVVRQYQGKVPILGVCLGHQVIGSVYGARVLRGAEPVHGKTDTVRHTDGGLFCDIPASFTATRYHSLIVEPEGVPELRVTARSATDDTVMAMEHSQYPVYGLQFHPESFASEYGSEMIRNFLKQCTTHYPLKEDTPC